MSIIRSLSIILFRLLRTSKIVLVFIGVNNDVKTFLISLTVDKLDQGISIEREREGEAEGGKFVGKKEYDALYVQEYQYRELSYRSTAC